MKTPIPNNGRPRRFPDEGPMVGFSIRVPQSLRKQIDFIFRNTDAHSISDVVVKALKNDLPKQMERIKSKS